MITTGKRIITTYLLLSGMYTFSASLIWGINTLFLLNAGMNIFQVFTVNAIFSASMAIFEIPTGVFADTLGRKISFLFSTMVLTLGTIGYVIVGSLENNFWMFCVMSAVLGLAFTFYSGAVEAWLVDALHEVEHKEELDDVFAKGMIVSNIAMLIGTTSGGLLGTLSLNIPYIVRASVQVIVLLLAIFNMKDIGFVPRKLQVKEIPAEMKKIAKESIRYGLGKKSTRHLMTITFIFSSFMMWGWYAWQPYFLKLYGDISAVWIAGFIAAGISLSQIAGSFFLKKTKRLFKYRTTVLKLAFGLQSITIIIIGLTNSFVVAVSMFILFAFALGLTMPIRQAYMHNIIPSEHRATIISLDSLVGSSGSVFGQLGYGYIAQTISIPRGYLIGGIVNLLIFPFIFLLKKQDDKANEINDK